MKFSIRTGLAIGALAAAIAMPASAQTAEDIQLNEYRIETEDCIGCGAAVIRGADDLRAYLDGISNARAERDAANGIFVGARDRNSTNRSGRNGPAQVVFLDFDAGGLPTFPVCRSNGTLFGVFQDHVYTPEERDTIQARIEADYADFNFEFVQEAPLSGDFTTILFGQNDAPLDCSEGSNITLTPTGGLSILFGQAESIDFLNANRSDNAFADASLWEFLVQLTPGNPNNFQNFSGLLVANFGGDITAAVSQAVVNQSANTGAHEAGHIMGLRHQNAFGAPGDGLPATGAILPTDFVPVFDGPSNATETVLHTMASGASVGLGLTGSTITDRFFSERSAVRLAVNEQGGVEDEDGIRRRRDRITLRNILTPNTIIEGQNEEARLQVRGAVVDGTIGALGETDSYEFFGREGDFFNAELVSVVGRSLSFEDGILGQLRLFQMNDDGTETLIAANFQSFESVFDAEIFDAVLPATGRYRLEVSAPDEFFPFGDDTPFPLSLAGGAALLTGQYSVLIYTCDKQLRGRDRTS